MRRHVFRSMIKVNTPVCVACVCVCVCSGVCMRVLVGWSYGHACSTYEPLGRSIFVRMLIGVCSCACKRICENVPCMGWCASSWYVRACLCKRCTIRPLGWHYQTSGEYSCCRFLRGTVVCPRDRQARHAPCGSTHSHACTQQRHSAWTYPTRKAMRRGRPECQ